MNDIQEEKTGIIDSAKPVRCLMGVSVSCKFGRIQIYDSTLSAIGNPEYFKFLFDDGRSKIAIKACEMNEEGAFKSHKTKKGIESYIHCTYFVSFLYDRYHWKKNSAYLLAGRFYAAQNVVEFDINEAVTL